MKKKSTQTTTIKKKTRVLKSEPLRITSIHYKEYDAAPKEWVLEEMQINDINLIVGKNASGKSRLSNVINGLSRMLTGDQPKVFAHGYYDVKFSTKKRLDYLQYKVSLKNGQVISEELYKMGKLLFQRGAKGVGKILAIKIGRMIDFETPPDQLAAKNRRDTIQHPYLEDLHNWANDLRCYLFATPMGRDQVILLPTIQSDEKKEVEIRDGSQAARIYFQGYKKYNRKFDAAIIRDMKLLGYNCTKIGIKPIELVAPVKEGPVLGLFVKEKDLLTDTEQLAMSQGMFRALALVIHLNYFIFKNKPRTIIIDDIGEGLDFERSKQFISLLIERAQRNGIQLIMTTNDRFVMNGVPLKYWGVISREGNIVKVVNIHNSKKLFDSFENLGLNNFDFFAGGFFKGKRNAA